MRKFIFYGCIALGAGIGVLVGASQGSIGLAIMFGLKFAIPGLALGALLTVFWGGGSDQEKMETDIEHDAEWERLTAGNHDGSGEIPEEIVENYWRDKGYPPFMNPEHFDPTPTPEEQVANQLLDRVNPSLQDVEGHDGHGT